VIKPCTSGNHVKRIERLAGILRTFMRARVATDLVWTELDVCSIEHSINASCSQGPGSDGSSAFEKLFGYLPPSPLTPVVRLERTSPAVAASLAEERSRGWFRPSFIALQDELLARAAAGAEIFDRHRHESPIVAKSVVAIHTDFIHIPVNAYKSGVGAKCRKLYHGPFQVLSIDASGNLLVDLANGKPALKVHQSHAKLLPPSSLAVPFQEGQPAHLLWPDGSPKVRMIISQRSFHKSTQFLAVFWGQHTVHARWVTAADVPLDRRAIAAYERRVLSRSPSRLPP
jgi:hypothetical protein